MKISILQEHLSKALNLAVKAVSSRPNIPVLANVLIKTEKGRIKLSTTNLEIGINAWVGAEIKEEGAVTVSARLITEFINTLGHGKLDLSQESNSYIVKSSDNVAQFFIIPAEDFPNVPHAEKDPLMVLNGFSLAEGLSKTIFACANEDSRPVLTGVLMEVEKNKLRLVGVDGFRLSLFDLELEKGIEDKTKFIIPAKALQEVERIIRDQCTEKDNVEIYMLGDKNQILFKINDIEISSRIIEGEFPDYNQIIPKEKINTFNVLKSELQNANKLIMIFARNVIGYKTKFGIYPTEKKLKMSVNVIDIGNNETSIDIAKIQGESLETSYNAKFMMDMVNSMAGDEIVYETNGALAPGVFKDKSNEKYVHVIMPMRLD